MSQAKAHTRTTGRNGSKDSKKPTGRRIASNSVKARFLEEVDKGTPLDELADEYAAWRRRRGLDTGQADLSGWSA